MKKLFFALIVAAVASFAVSPMRSYAADVSSVASEQAGQATDFFDDANGKVADVTEALYDAIADKATDEQALSMLMNGLEKVGIKGGWARKLGELNKIKGVTNAFSKAISALNAGKTTGKLAAAYQNNDKSAFRSIVADQLTDLAAGLVSAAVVKVIQVAGTAAIGAAALTGPGFIIAGGAVLVAQWVVGGWVEEKISDAIKDGSMYGAFQKVGDMIWDMLGGRKDDDTPEKVQICLPGENPGDDHPGFDEPPENGPGNSGGSGRYQGLKALKLIE